MARARVVEEEARPVGAPVAKDGLRATLRDLGGNERLQAVEQAEACQGASTLTLVSFATIVSGGLMARRSPS